MRRIAVTTRVFVPDSRCERWDCLDQALARLLIEGDCLPIPVPNVLAAPSIFFDDLGIDGLVLSGGNDTGLASTTEGTAPERDRLEAQLVDIAAGRGAPVLGICRGAQVLHALAGGRLVQDDRHVARPHRVHVVGPAPADWPERFDVNSFHRWVIPSDDLADGLRPLALADGGASVEAFVHREQPFLGVMWHPERVGVPEATARALVAWLRGDR